MAINDFGTLKTAVDNWLDRTDLTSRVPEFIELAEDRIGNEPKLRIRAMEKTTDLTISGQTTALPARYVRARRLYLDTSPIRKLTYLTPVNFWTIHAAGVTSKPEAFTIEGDNLVVGPAPDISYTGKFLYWEPL